MVGVGGRSHVKRCHTCRQRKVKCDGGTPACGRCLDHGLQCPGYTRKLEFVFYDNGPSSRKNAAAPKTQKLPATQQIQLNKQSTDYAVMMIDKYEIHSHSLSVPQNKAGLMAVLQNRYEKFDQLQQHPQDSSATSVISQLNNLLLEGLALQQAFTDWEYRILGGQEKSLLYIPRQARPMGNYHSPYPISFTFTNWDNGSLCYYEMLRIFLYTLLIDISAFAQQLNITPPALSRIDTLDLTRRSIECADRICQSTEWFLEDHKKLIGRMMILAPFEAAKGLFLRLVRDSTGDVEQDEMLKKKSRFCEMITQRIVDSGSPVWGG